MMDISLNSAPSIPVTQSRALLQISLEALVYLAIFMLALGLRLAQLDDAPLSATQAHEAIAALHRIDPAMTENPAIARNPLMALTNQVLFFLLSANNFTARVSTALVGTLLVVGAWLWRDRLGPTAAILMALFLAISPTALASARLMGGVTWTMAVALVVVWAMLRAAERRDKGLAVLATVGVSAMLFLTEPTGAITVLGLGFGLLVATWINRNDGVRLEQHIADIVAAWPWRDALLATLATIVVIGTGFFATPEGLTSVGNTIYHLVADLTSRPPELPMAFALLVALRYDVGLVLFGLLGMYFALVQEDRFSRFLAGWLMFSVAMSILYQNPPPDAALWIVVPGAALTARLATQMLRNPSIGYWVVPNWGVPVHAFITASLLIAIALNAIRISHVVYLETRPFGYHFISSPQHGGEISTINSAIPENTYQIEAVANLSFVVQIWRFDGNVEPTMRVVTQQVLPSGGSEEVLVSGPFAYDELRKGVVVSLRSGGTYYLKVAQPFDQPDTYGQFALLTHPPEAIESGPLFNYQLDMPFFWTLVRSLANQKVPPFTIMITVFLVLLLVIGYFLAGSVWGSRAAWRGLGFGILLYLMLYSMGLGWQISVVYADDPRELWHFSDPSPLRTAALVETLGDMSLQAEGINNAISITVKGANDTPLAWSLRNFPHVKYVNSVGVETDTQAVIVPFEEQDTILGADYVGQDYILSQSWRLSYLNWTDFLAWLSLRETRIQPLDDEWIMLWVRKDVYGVREVIPTQSQR